VKRIVKLVSLLYPSSWRNRYGAEFEALLDDVKPSPLDAFDVLQGGMKMRLTMWSTSRTTFASALLGLCVAVAVALALPAHYISRAVLVVEPTDEFARNLTNTLVQGSAFNRELLASLIQEYDLYPRDRIRMSLDEVIDKMQKNIQVVSTMPASSADREGLTFAIQFEYPNRHVAQQINEELIKSLIEGNLNAQPTSHSTFYVPAPPSLPRWPATPDRTRFAAVGLFAGLLAGLTLGVIRARSRTTV
jgi:LPS O-antigen subunit length determinant protein (WzzB/FepE family)